MWPWGVPDHREPHFDQACRQLCCESAHMSFNGLYADLLARWGDLDPELIRARGFMEWQE